MEIERQFLVDDIKNIDIDIEKHQKKHYLQTYISTNPVIRVRKEGERLMLCVKGHGNMVREEWEMELDEAQYNNLLTKAETDTVSKYRYFIPLESGRIAELDVYLEQLAGLYTVEVEFNTVEEANSFTPLSWFGKEVTNEEAYKNVNLAKYGLPKY